MADGRLFKQVKVHIPQKALVYRVRDMCVQYEKTEICSGNEMQTDGGRTSEVTLIPRTNFVGRGITITDTLTDKVTLSYRVSQGSVLGPVFALYTTPL